MPSQFRVFMASPSASPFLGEVTIIIAAWPKDDFSYRGECFVMVERAPATLHQTKLSFNAASVPEGMIDDNLHFVQEAALRAGKSEIARLLKARFDVTSDRSVFAAPMEYQEVDRNHLAHLWILGRWTEELKQVFSTSECEELIEWLRTVKQCQPISITTTTLKCAGQ